VEQEHESPYGQQQPDLERFRIHHTMLRYLLMVTNAYATKYIAMRREMSKSSTASSRLLPHSD
jgi:hypothetical protein